LTLIFGFIRNDKSDQNEEVYIIPPCNDQIVL